MLHVHPAAQCPQDTPMGKSLIHSSRRGCLASSALAASPCPMRAPVRASLALPKPSSRHTTLADCRFQRSSQIVPHSLLLSTSTRPSPTLAPPFSRIRGCGSRDRCGTVWNGTTQCWPRLLGCAGTGHRSHLLLRSWSPSNPYTHTEPGCEALSSSGPPQDSSPSLQGSPGPAAAAAGAVSSCGHCQWQRGARARN